MRREEATGLSEIGEQPQHSLDARLADDEFSRWEIGGNRNTQQHLRRPHHRKETAVTAPARLPMQQADDSTGHAGGHGARHDGLQSQLGNLQASLRYDGANPADHDADAAGG